MEERRLSQEQLQRTMEEQNKLLAQILGFVSPIAAFFTALKVVLKGIAWVVSGSAAAYAVWEAMKAYARQ